VNTLENKHAVSVVPQFWGVALISRRKWFGAVMLGWLTSSGATNSDPVWHGSLAQVLQALPAIDTAAKFIDKFGEPFSRQVFSYDDPDNEYFPNRYSRESWKRSGVITPPDLIDNVPIGTGILTYDFRFGSAINPTKGVLLIFVDKKDRILGWKYSGSLVGYERKALLTR
jgi:hypothetical protein